MNDVIENCPCSGKNSSNFAAPWILLTLHKSEGMHGYALAEEIGARLEEFGVGLNITGIYRHLAALEKRGMLKSEMDESGRAASRKKYILTESGLICLHNWMRTLQSQAAIIEAFFKEAEVIIPSAFDFSKD